MANAADSQVYDVNKNLSVADYVETLPEDVKQTVKMTNFDSSIAKFVFFTETLLRVGDQLQYRG